MRGINARTLLGAFDRSVAFTLSNEEKAVLLDLVEPAVALLNTPQFRWKPLDRLSVLPDRMEDVLVQPFIRNAKTNRRKAALLARLLLEWTRQVGLNSYFELSSLGELDDGHILDYNWLGSAYGVKFIERVVLAQHRHGTYLDPYVSPITARQSADLSLCRGRQKVTPLEFEVQAAPGVAKTLRDKLECWCTLINGHAIDVLVWLVILTVMATLLWGV